MFVYKGCNRHKSVLYNNRCLDSFSLHNYAHLLYGKLYNAVWAFIKQFIYNIYIKPAKKLTMWKCIKAIYWGLVTSFEGAMAKYF